MNDKDIHYFKGILRKVLCSCKFHIPYSLIATKLLPPLIPLLISKDLSLAEVSSVSLTSQFSRSYFLHFVSEPIDFLLEIKISTSYVDRFQ